MTACSSFVDGHADVLVVVDSVVEVVGIELELYIWTHIPDRL